MALALATFIVKHVEIQEPRSGGKKVLYVCFLITANAVHRLF